MFGRLVLKHRRRLGLTQEELADKSGLSVRTVRRLEAGQSQVPRAASVRRLAAAFHLHGAEWESFLRSASGAKDTKALSELLELRKVLETALIEDAMRALTPQSREALKSVLAQAKERAERGETFPDQDRDFHGLLFADLGNEMLLRLFDLFWVAYNRASPPNYGQTPMDSYQWHADIVDAVVSGDSERARTAVREHYLGIEQRNRTPAATRPERASDL
jgi:DNA-binding FadR family transcriptional regulator